MKTFPNLAILLASIFLTLSASAGNHKDERINVLLVTVDDMNWNSVGAFGNPIVGITPNIDRFAMEGRRYARAYVTASNCSPSRVAIQTGLYPQQSGATGFFYIDDRDTPSIATELRKQGYFSGVINKTADTNPSPDIERYWDFRADFNQTEKFSARNYRDSSAAFFQKSKQRRQPFYLVVNIADPHKPNFNDPQAAATGADVHVPSRVIAESEVTVPGFLPDLPKIRRDVRNYYNSVKRADDVFGEVMNSLRDSGLEDNTLVIFLSDHGMPFPFAKSSVYDNGLRTPLIMKLPGKIEAGSVDTDLASAVDLMPTIMDAAGVGMPPGHTYLGRSLLSAEHRGKQRFAFGGFDDNARGYPVPMRGAISEDWGYVFNAWSDGKHTVRNDDMNHLSFKEMVRRSSSDPRIKARLDFYLAPPTEELCHLATDPDCLINLAGDPAHAGVLADMQAALRAHMVRTDDYLLEAFDVRGDQARLQAFMDRLHDSARHRAARLQWKRSDNIAGKTRSNRQLFRKERRRSANQESIGDDTQVQP